MEFKHCSTCNGCWETRDSFLYSDEIKLIGYQPDFEAPGDGLLLFNHIQKKCGTTMALRAELFFDLFKGPIYQELQRGAPECGGHCLNVNTLAPCGAKCSMAHIRQIMQIILSLHDEK